MLPWQTPECRTLFQCSESTVLEAAHIIDGGVAKLFLSQAPSPSTRMPAGMPTSNRNDEADTRSQNRGSAGGADCQENGAGAVECLCVTRFSWFRTFLDTKLKT